MNFIFSQCKQYFTHLLRSFVKYCFHHLKIKSISLPCNILYIFHLCFACMGERFLGFSGKRERNDNATLVISFVFIQFVIKVSSLCNTDSGVGRLLLTNIRQRNHDDIFYLSFIVVKVKYMRGRREREGGVSGVC